MRLLMRLRGMFLLSSLSARAHLTGALLGPLVYGTVIGDRWGGRTVGDGCEEPLVLRTPGWLFALRSKSPKVRCRSITPSLFDFD